MACSKQNGNQIGKNFVPNAWLRINFNGNVTIILAKSEMGQGVMTALPMLVAEESEVAWNVVSVVQADSPLEPAYGNQSTGGSGSVRSSWLPLRQAGAIAKTIFVKAAAQQWGVKEVECEVRLGVVYHKITNRSVKYEDLVERAVNLPLPQKVVLKDPKDFQLIGTSVPRADIHFKINGNAEYGADIKVPGLMTVVVVHCPVFGGTVANLDASEALKVKGVGDVVQIDSGVAVIADDFWSAQKGKSALKIQWSKTPSDPLDSGSIQQRFINALELDGVIAQKIGTLDSDIIGNSPVIEANYELPFQAHATMEPMSCTADLSDGKCEVWAPTQSPGDAFGEVLKHGLPEMTAWYEKIKRKLTGKSLDYIQVHTTMLGCGFGRRLQQDYVREAVQISRAINKPIKLMWSREEDMQHDYYRPASYNRITAFLDEKGLPIAWKHKIVGPSINNCLWPGSIKRGDVDPLAVEGARDLPYSVENVEITWVEMDTTVPVGMWRSVGHSQNAFVVESFIDELAIHSKQDPLEYRLRLLKDASRHRAVLETVADMAHWGRVLPEGHFHGLAVHKSYFSYVAHIVELSVEDNGHTKVHKVTSAIDCGMVINPDIVKAQIESAIAFGLTATLKSSITIKNGQVEQSNFHDFPIIKMNEMPKVDVHIIPSHESPAGIGEPGVPPVAPAVANAVFRATGKRIRRLPLLPKDVVS